MEVSLLEIDNDLAQTLAEDPRACESRYGVCLGENAELIRQVIEQTLVLFKAVPRSTPWGGYLAVDEDTKNVVGTCGLKAGPDSDGVIEMAYFTFPSFEGCGIATAMAGLLIELARSSHEVREVVAHTLPERNASTRVLEKVGMERFGKVIHPEDGPVWRWSRSAISR
ncbi:MAG: GNAT family N-acetyltransferase [Phycisphaerales bacterium]|nr:MAG: GNAT family N-acetyltransferase [Phycisphaerales bacterium]